MMKWMGKASSVHTQNLASWDVVSCKIDREFFDFFLALPHLLHYFSVGCVSFSLDFH